MSSPPGGALPGPASPGPARLVTAIVIAFVIAALIGLSLRSGTSEPEDDGGTFGATMSEAGCREVESFEEEGTEHVDNGTEVDYSTAIPTSGTHWQSPAEAGFYEEPIPVAQLVHNLEHGQVVIYYQDVAEVELAELADYVVGNGALVATPAPDDAGSPVTFVAWTKLQSCERLSSEALDGFREQFQGRAPEPITPPFEG